MRTLVLLLAIAILGAAAASSVCAAELPAAAEAEQELPPPQALGEVSLPPQLQALSGVEALVVNGDRITIEDVRQRAFLYHYPYICQDMVEEKLLEQEARRRSITVSDEEIEAWIKSFRDEMGLRSELTLQSFLRASRNTYEWLHTKARYAVLVRDKEIEQFYQVRREAYRRGDYVEFRIISFPTQDAANAALEELRKGRSFQEVAKEAARNPAERAIAGELRSRERGQQPAWPSDFEAAVLAAPLNQAVIVPAQNAYHIIRVEKKIDPHQFTFEEVRDVIRDQLRRQKLETVVLPNWIRMQLANAQIEVIKAQ